MLPRLVPEISPLDAFCDVVGVVVGIGDSRSWIGVLGESWQSGGVGVEYIIYGLEVGVI